MTFEELQDAVQRYWAMERRRRRVEVVARNVAALLTVIGAWLVVYAIHDMLMPVNISIPIMTDLRNYIVSAFAQYDVQPLAAVIIAGIVFAVPAFLCTFLYWLCEQKLRYHPQNKEETLKNAMDLKKQFEYIEHVDDIKNKINIGVYLVGATLMFTILEGGFYFAPWFALVSYPIFFIIRGVFIVPAKVFWKNDRQLRSKIAVELMVTIKRIEKREEERETELKRQKKIEEERRKQQKLEEDMREGQKLYNDAMASDPVDDVLMEKAAALGNAEACFYIGKKLLADWRSDLYTAEEKRKIIEEAAKCFNVVRQQAELTKADIKTECTFLWLFSRLKYEGNTESKWKQMLEDFRSVKKAGDLPVEYHVDLEQSIISVINIINSFASDSNTQSTYHSEPAMQPYCKFRNGAICTKLSGSIVIHECNYVNNPGSCSTALMEHGLGFR